MQALKDLVRRLTDTFRAALGLWSRLSLPHRILGVAAGLFVAVTSILSYLRHLTYQTNAWDLGIYMQSLWTTAFPRDFFYYTAELSWNGSGSLFGVHFMPLLGLLVPVYALAPSAATLFVIQSGAVAASVFPLYHLMLRRTDGRYALGLSLAYLASPPLLAGIFFDFHIESFLPVTTLWTWLIWESRRYKLLPVAMMTMLSVIEFAPVILTAMALMFLVKGARSWSRARRDGAMFPRIELWLPLVVIPLGIVLTFVFFSIPKVVSPNTPPLLTVGPLGGSLTEILRNAIINPGLILQALAINASTKALYLIGIWVAALGLWVLRPLDGLPALPWILVALLTAFPLYAYPASNQYGFLVVPFLFPATATGVQAVIERKRRRLEGREERDSAPIPQTTRLRTTSAALRNPLVVFLIILLVASQLAMNPVSPLSSSWEGVGRLPGEHEATVRTILGMIPDSASVSAQPDLFPHVANRREAYPYLVPGVEYVVVDLTSWWFTSDFPAPATNPPWIEQLKGNATADYGVLASASGVLLCQRGYRGTPVIFLPVELRLPPERFIAPSADLVPDVSSPMRSYLVPQGSEPNTTLWFGPYVMLPPGAFQVRIWLRAPDPMTGSIWLRATIDSGNRTLGSLLVTAGAISANWDSLLLTISVPYPGFFELVGVSSNTPSSIQFGGVELAQLQRPVILGR